MPLLQEAFKGWILLSIVTYLAHNLFCIGNA